MFRIIVSLWLLSHSLAMAISIEIVTSPDDETSRLEYRPIIAPDGRELEILLVRGSPVRVNIDDNVVVAEHIEFDFANRRARIIGFGRFITASETIEGSDFEISLGDETFSAQDVVIVTASLDITGLSATRVPGQIDVQNGSFSPCRRCGQEIEDYSFQAQRMLFYPGDRLVAYNVTVLIRGVPAFFLPLAVFPLGPQDRQPRLIVARGSETQRAEVMLEWPYVVGSSAFGFSSLRYYADVSPGTGNFFSEEFLGGGVEESYFGYAVEHRFIDETGEGELAVDYTPAFRVVSDGEADFTEELLSFRLNYQSDPELSPVTALSISRQDSQRRQGLVEYSLATSNLVHDLEVGFNSRGYLDVNNLGLLPSYGSPYRTLAQLKFTPQATQSFSLGSFTLSNVAFDIGAFQDRSSPFNRSAASEPEQEALRVLESHSLALLPLTPWEGLSISGSSRFRGQYYSTAERLVDWQTALTASQTVADIASLDISFNRSISEGESPFAFDGNRFGGSLNRMDLRAKLALTPFPWLRLESSESYIFLDTRNQDLQGFGPIVTSLTLFEDRSWIDLRFSETYNVKDDDPGNLEANLTLRYAAAVDTSFSLNHIEDLEPQFSEDGSLSEDESQTEFVFGLGFQPYVSASLTSTYIFEPLPIVEDQMRSHWLPLQLSLSAGTLTQDDQIPGLKLDYDYDLNEDFATALTLESSARYGDLEVSYKQGFNLDLAKELEDNPNATVSPTLGQTRFQLSWRNIASLELLNVELIPPGLLGLETDEGTRLARRTISAQVAEQALRDGRQLRRWLLGYETRFDPNRTPESALEPGFYSNSKLTANVALDQRDLGDLGYSLKLNASYLLADDALSRSHLDSLSLSLQTQWFDRVGIQGELVYDGDFNNTTEIFSQQRLSFKEFAITARLLDDLFISSVFGEGVQDQINDSWDFSLDNPYVFQPTIYLIWDRCCWALHGRWDTFSGDISIFIGAPGAAEGIGQSFESPLILPGRELETDQASP